MRFSLAAGAVSGKTGPMEQIEVDIHTSHIRLDGLLKFAALVATGGEAKFLIQNAQVEVNDRIETRRGHRVVPGDRVRLCDHDGQPLAEVQVRESGEPPPPSPT